MLGVYSKFNQIIYTLDTNRELNTSLISHNTYQETIKSVTY